jgi:hypothetical protein
MQVLMRRPNAPWLFGLMARKPVRLEAESCIEKLCGNCVGRVSLVMISYNLPTNVPTHLL